MLREFLCSDCEKKCIVSIDKIDGNLEITGYKCEAGKIYAKKRLKDKKEILTTLVRIKGGYKNVLPVKSSGPIDISLHIECSKALSRLNAGAPVRIGDVVCTNILNTGVDIISVENVDKIYKAVDIY
jgi:CxxC motif-containing protein